MAILDLPATRTRVTKWAKRYSPFQIFLAGLLAVVVGVGAFVGIGMINKPSYSLLYGSLDPADTAKITTQLTTAGIPFELDQGGNTVLVPNERVAEAKISLASAGLPKKAAVGYEALDGQPLTTSNAREKINIQRALEGNLANTLMGIDGVSNASVLLGGLDGNVPNTTLFSDQQTPVTASVTLTTDHTLTDDQVSAVVHLVSSAVQGLDPSHVTVVDSNGRLLSGSDSSSIGGTTAQDKATQSIQQQLTAKAASILAPLGSDKYTVQVAATLSFDQRSQQSETFVNPPTATCPNTAAPGTVCQLKAADNTSKETYVANDTTSTGPLTTTPNTVVTGPGTGTANTNTTGTTTTPTPAQSYTSDKSASEYKVDRTVTNQVDAIGTVKKLSVSVVVDSSVAKADVAKLSAAVGSAIGLEQARGDTITVTQLAFSKQASPVVDKTAADAAARMQMIGTYAGAALLLFSLIFLWLRLRTRTEPIDIEELMLSLTPAASTSNGPRDTLQPNGGLRSDADMLLARVDQAPRDAADVLRGWIADDQAGI